MVDDDHIDGFLGDLLEADSAQEVLEASATAASAVLEADTAHILTVDDGVLDVLATTESALANRDDLPVTTDIVGQLDLIGRSHVFDDITDVRSVAAASVDSPGITQPRSLLVVPIEEVGMLVATAQTPGAFDTGDQHWGEQLASLVERLLEEDTFDAGEPTNSDRLEQIASTLSHDFKGPLTVVRGSLELAKETGDPTHIERAHTAIDRIEHLIDGLYRVANADAEFPRTELVEVRSVVEDVWPTIDGAGETTLDVVDSRTILADEHAFAQLLTNLLANAVEHGGETVTVGTMDGGIYVEDDGDGVPPEDREVIFTWGHTTGSDHKGIGLCIAKQIADVHDWSLSVTDGTDGGARFELTGIDD